MYTPTLKLQIAPGALATDRNPNWSDIGDRALQWSYKRGRPVLSESADVGTMDVEVNNTDRALDPSYTTGPYYGGLHTNMQIRMVATVAGTDFPLFRGFVMQLPMEYPHATFTRSKIQAVDPLAPLAEDDISADLPEELSGDRIFRVLGYAEYPRSAQPTSGWQLGVSKLGTETRLGVATPLLTKIDAGMAVIAAQDLSATKEAANTHLQAVALSEPGYFYFDGAGDPVFRDRSRLTPVPEAARFTLMDADAGNPDSTHVEYMEVVPVYDISRIKNWVEVTTLDGRVTTLYDQPSIDLHRRRTLTRSVRLRGETYTPDSFQLAGYLLAQGKADMVRFEQAKVAITDATVAALVLALEPGMVVDLEKKPRGAPGSTAQLSTQTSVVEQVQVDGSPRGWYATIALSPIYVTPNRFQLGVTPLGTARLSYV